MHTRSGRVVAIAALALAFAAAAFAAPAEAGHGKRVRYKGVVVPPPPVVVAPPVAIYPAMRARPWDLPAGYVYWDAACGRSFVSLAHYRRHLARHHHGWSLRIVSADVLHRGPRFVISAGFAVPPPWTWQVAYGHSCDGGCRHDDWGDGRYGGWDDRDDCDD